MPLYVSQEDGLFEDEDDTMADNIFDTAFKAADRVFGSIEDEEAEDVPNIFTAINTGNQLLEMLDNVSAAMETVMLQFGQKMTPADQASRQQLVDEARETCNKLLRGA